MMGGIVNDWTTAPVAGSYSLIVFLDSSAAQTFPVAGSYATPSRSEVPESLTTLFVVAIAKDETVFPSLPNVIVQG